MFCTSSVERAFRDWFTEIKREIMLMKIILIFATLITMAV